jgi:hypothetical protein
MGLVHYFGMHGMLSQVIAEAAVAKQGENHPGRYALVYGAVDDDSREALLSARCHSEAIGQAPDHPPQGYLELFQPFVKERPHGFPRSEQHTARTPERAQPEGELYA